MNQIPSKSLPDSTSLNTGMTAARLAEAGLPRAEEARDQLFVGVIDPQPVVCEGMSNWLDGQDGIRVVAEASDPALALTRLRQVRPDVAVTELRFPNGGGPDLIRRLREELPRTRLAVFTHRPTSAFIEVCRRLGVAGVFDKRWPLERLLKGVMTLVRGRPTVPGGGVAAAGKPSQPAGGVRAGSGSPRQAAVSRREKEVLDLLGRGWTTSRIAAGLNCSPKTVEFHRDSLRRKLGCRSGAEMVHWAIQWTEASR